MSFAQKNIIGTLVSFSLILLYYLIRLSTLIQTDSFIREEVVHLWVIVVIATIVVTVTTMILTHIFSAVSIAVKTQAEPEIDETEDERDKLIDLKGTSLTHQINSIGVLLAMLTFVFGKPAVIMFSLVILSGIIAQIAGDAARLYFYRNGV